MDGTDREMTLRDYGRVIARRKWIIVLSVVLCTGAALAMSFAQTPVYESEGQLLVQTAGGDGLFVNNDTYFDQDRAIQTEIQVLQGQQVEQRVGEDLGVDDPAGVDAAAVEDTDVVTISVQHSDPASAQVLVDGYAKAYIDIRREQRVDNLLAAGAEVRNKIGELEQQVVELDQAIADADPSEQGAVAESSAAQRTSFLNQIASFQTTLDELQVDAALRTGGATVVQPASLPTSPIEPTPQRTVAIALAVALLIGLGAAFLIDYLDDSIDSEEALEHVAAAPVLAVVPVDPPPDDRPVALSRPDDHAVETYRGLRTNIQFLGLDRPLKVVQITSSLAGEGKTTTATNLAVVLAQAGNRVCIVDCDLRRPRLHEAFAAPQRPGLTDLLLGQDVQAVVTPVFAEADGSLDLIASGNVPPNPGELLSGRRLERVLADVAARYEYVIVDSAPILPIADSVALAAVVDGVVLVTQAGRTSTKNVRGSLDRLERISAPLIGLVLNRASGGSGSGYGYGYGYGYSARTQTHIDEPEPEPDPTPPRVSEDGPIGQWSAPQLEKPAERL